MSTTGRSLPDLTIFMSPMTHIWAAARPQSFSLRFDAGVGRCICAPSTQNVSLSGGTSSCSPLANTTNKMWFWSALLFSPGLASLQTLQRRLLKLISTFWTVLRVCFTSALRMLLWSTWTKIRLKRVFAFLHDIAIIQYTLLDVDVAIVLFVHGSNSQIKAPAAVSAAILIWSQVPGNYWQK